MQRYAERNAYLGVVVAGVLVALLLAAALNPWLDEGYSLLSTRDGIAEALRRAIVFEWQAPLYFVALAAWRALASGVFFARLPSVACYLAVLAMVPALVRRYAPGAPVAVVAAAFAVAPFALETAVEIRPYALAVALSAAFLIAFSDAFLVPIHPRRAAILCVVLALGLVYTHYYAAVLVAGAGCAAVLASDPKRRRAAVIAGVAVAAGTLPLLGVLRSQLRDARTSGEPSLIPEQDLVDVAVLPLRFATGNMADHTLRFALIALALLAAALVIARFRRRRSLPPIAVMLVASTAVLLVLFSFVGTRPALPRYAMAIYLPAVLTPFAFIVRSRRAHLLALTWGAVILIGSLASDVIAYRPLAKIGDWYRVARYVDQHGPPNAPIAIYPAEDALAAAASMSPAHRVVAVPAAVDPRRPAGDDHLRDPGVAGAVLVRAAADGPIWLARATDCPHPAGCAAVKGALRTRFTVLDRVTFYHETIELIRPR